MPDSSFFGFHVNVPDEAKFGIIVGSTLLAGFSSGLLLCLFSLDTRRLNALIMGPNTKDARRARRVMMLLHKPHWLLVTLLLLEDIAVEMMPLVLNMLLNPVAAIFVSVGILLIFGEIIPQAIFVRYALQVSAALAYVVLFIMCLTSPITWPIGKLLDLVVGDKETVFLRRRELRELIRLQEELHRKRRIETVAAVNEQEYGEGGENESFTEADISPMEADIMLGALSMSENTARDVLSSSIDSVFSLHRDAVINREVTDYIFSKGIQFIPVYDDINDPTTLTGVLEAKVLIILMYRHESNNILVHDFPLQPLPRFPVTVLCSELFEILQHMVSQVIAICEENGEVTGIITMRDVVEFVHQRPFQAEMDPGGWAHVQLMMSSWKRLREVNGDSAVTGSFALGSYGRRGADGVSHNVSRTPSGLSSRSHSPLIRRIPPSK